MYKKDKTAKERVRHTIRETDNSIFSTMNKLMTNIQFINRELFWLVNSSVCKLVRQSISLYTTMLKNLKADICDCRS